MLKSIAFSTICNDRESYQSRISFEELSRYFDDERQTFSNQPTRRFSSVIQLLFLLFM